MISFILRLINEFKQEHGYQPNLLYINELHFNYLKSGFADEITLQQICEAFQMELIVNREVVHPHVAWTHTAERLAV